MMAHSHTLACHGNGILTVLTAKEKKGESRMFGVFSQQWLTRRVILALALLVLPLAAAVGAADGGGNRGTGGNNAPELTRAEIRTIIAQAVSAANRTASANGLRSNTDPARGPVVKRPTKMVVAVAARDGKLLDVFVMPDAWVGSQDIAIAKARTAAFFSSNENALTSRVIGDLSQPGGPLWGIGNSNQVGVTGSPQFRNGIITFPGGVPLYKGNTLVGGVGVSGDAVDQDEAVAFAGAAGFEPGPAVVKLGFSIPSVPAFP
jgi:uncharacterized protein GlcG (DUF336 family)